jgi:ketosteroid isomerase-like protein
VTHPNEDLIRGGYEAFAQGDIPGVLKVFSPEIVWTIPGRSPLAGVYRGHDGVLGFFTQLGERSGGTFRLELVDLLANDTRAVALTREQAEREGRALDVRGVHVWTIADGQATTFLGLPDDAYAEDEFWA